MLDNKYLCVLLISGSSHPYRNTPNYFVHGLADWFCRKVREGGRVMSLQQGDTLCFAAQCNSQNIMMVACSQGKVATYEAQEIPERVGRATGGVKAKSLKKGMLRL